MKQEEEDMTQRDRALSPLLTNESPTAHHCTVQHHVPIDPYAERMPRANF